MESIKERGILMSAPMVLALWEDRKFQTRRLVKPQPEVVTDRNTRPMQEGDEVARRQLLRKIPYPVGTRLWVKETHYRWGKWYRDGLTKTGKQRWRFKLIKHPAIGYRALFDHQFAKVDNVVGRGDGFGWVKRPSLFMTRDAARMTMDVTAVRVERLQAITAEDALAEGIVRTNDGGFAYDAEGRGYHGADPRESFAHLVDAIHGDGWWASNPWVWVYEWDKVEKAGAPAVAKAMAGE